MAKLIGPLHSDDARGKFAKSIVFSGWKGVKYARALVVPANPNSTEQQAIRSLITDASQAWRNEDSPIDTAYKAAYDLFAVGKPFSGFNAYIKDAVAKNEAEEYDGSLSIPTEPGDNTPA